MTFEFGVRLIFSLLVVVGLITLMSRTALKRRGFGSRQAIKVTHRQPLTRTASIAVAEVQGRTLLLGVTETSVNLITELAEPLAAASDEANDAGTPGSVINIDQARLHALRAEPDQSNQVRPVAFAGEMDMALRSIGDLPHPAARQGDSSATRTPARDAASEHPRPQGAGRHAARRPADVGTVPSGFVLSPRTWRAAGQALRQLRSA